MIKQCMLVAAAASLHFPLPAPAAAQSNAPPVQFVQTAKSVDFKNGVLTLQNASLMTTFFSDRPQRLTGQIRNDLFSKLWSEGKNSFKNDPPNATLSVFNPGGQPRQAVLVLRNPRLDGKSISYDATLLMGDVPQGGAESTLFIDGYDTPCNSGANNPAYSDYPCWAATAFSRAPR